MLSATPNLLVLHICAGWLVLTKKVLAKDHCLLQAASQRTRTQHTQLKPAHASSALAEILAVAGSLKFYTPSRATNCEENDSDQVDSGRVFPDGVRVDPGNGILSPVRRWLWANDERKTAEYVHHRLACSSSLVSSVEEADLCYPSCTSNSPVRTLAAKQNKKWMMQFCFEVPPSRRDSWWNCTTVCFHPENYGECNMEIPYLHGISWPSPSAKKTLEV